MLVLFTCFLHSPAGTRASWRVRADESRVGLVAGPVLGQVAPASWPRGEDKYKAGGLSIKVTLYVTASVSPEICFGCSVVDQVSGPEASPPLLRLEQPCVVPGGRMGRWKGTCGGRGNQQLRGEEPCVGRAPDSLSEWAGAREVLKLNVNPQLHALHEFLFPVAAHCPRLSARCGQGGWLQQHHEAEWGLRSHTEASGPGGDSPVFP